jgi:ABC-type transport system substrate-binding protein
MVRIRRTSLLLLPLALSTAAVAAAAPAASAAPVNHPVTIVVNTTFDPDVLDAFTGNVPGCGSGVVADTAGRGPKFTPWGGVFSGTKSFTCDEGGGFDVRLQALFAEAGSVGTWVVTDAWGPLEGLKGSGGLVGTPTEAGIDDTFVGTLR